MTIVSRRQRRIDACWFALTDKEVLGNEPDKWSKEPDIKEFYAGIRKTGSDIHTSGLTMALAFRASRGKAGIKVYRVLSRVCADSLNMFPDDEDLLQVLAKGDTTLLMLATEECTACCGVISSYLKGAGVKPIEAEMPESVSA